MKTVYSFLKGHFILLLFPLVFEAQETMRMPSGVFLFEQFTDRFC